MSKIKRVRKVVVNVQRNDSVDIRCGGPSVLGFDFHVDAVEVPKKLTQWLESQLAARHLPCMGISISRPHDALGKVWSRNQMAKEISQYCL